MNEFFLKFLVVFHWIDPPKNSQNFVEKAYYPDATPLKIYIRTHSIPAWHFINYIVVNKQMISFYIKAGACHPYWLYLFNITPPILNWWGIQIFCRALGSKNVLRILDGLVVKAEHTVSRIRPKILLLSRSDTPCSGIFPINFCGICKFPLSKNWRSLGL